ncbi:Zinc metalloproteinase nas-7 [Orchesella cincta]|uniref:Metalloendopeptidase n=1 Tax=Orchesella cincta TaxID=48709 RepID=A0A1D2N511_ORCCI|nr:Zinc metalloproteinase nas-7 [Orchesella cincta]
MKTIMLAQASISVLLIVISQTSSLPSPGLPKLPLPQRSRIDTRILESMINPNGTKLECTMTVEDEFKGRSGLIPIRYRWQNFNVFIDPAYNSNERGLINNAMYRLSQVLPCVRFGIWQEGSRPSGDYVHIKKASGCSAAVGKQGGAQHMSLASPGCMSMGTMMHEMIHSLGFYHEQSRPDRDDFVIVRYQNIQPGTEHNFNKYSSSQVSTFGVAYDLRSIMHYGSTAFSKNGQPTIIARNGGAVGSTGDLRNSDIMKLKRMYNC